MPMNTDDIIDTLNDLIETCKDGEAGFRTCAEDVGRAELKDILERAAERCGESALELQTEVLRLGGKPERKGSLAGSAHRRWVDAKSAITNKDEATILTECERGEDVAKASYQKALKKELPAEIRTVVQRQYQGLLEHHDMVRGLRDVEKAAKA